MDGKYIIESLEDGLYHSYKFSTVLFTGETPFQSVEVLQTQTFGRCLILDGLMQSSEVDEPIYHECLVHPAMLAHPNPKRVFIGGGGEGATLREVLRHNSVEECVMCDLDQKVVELCREHLVHHHKGVLAPGYPRVKLAFEDAEEHLRKSDGMWDVIILDLPDPVECGPAFNLYTKEFYEFCLTRLTSNGILVTQSGPMSVITHKALFAPVHNTLETVFPAVFGYGSHVPSFGHEWGFNVAFKNEDDAAIVRMEPEEVDKLIAARMDQTTLGELKFFDGITNRRIFSLSKLSRKCLNEEDRVVSKSNPMMFNAGHGIAEKK